MKCPICKGSGNIEEPDIKLKYDAQMKKQMALTLIENGYTFRQVQKFIGWKSPGSVAHILKRLKDKSHEV